MSYLFEKIIDLLFPKSISVLELEQMNISELLEELTPAKNTSDVQALFSYKDRKVRALVLEIKAHENEKLAEKISGMMCEKIIEIFEEDIQFGEHKIKLIPIPSSEVRIHERGYNPAELIARKICETRNDLFECAPILKKIKETKRQTNLSRKERLINLEGAFEAIHYRAPGLYVLIDDVYTTGATIQEAKRALEERNIHTKGAIVIAK